MIGRLLKGLAPLAALAMGASLGGCGGADLKINGEEGVPLSELDMSGAAPTELVVSADAKVVVSEGDTLTITVEDDPENALRFVLDDETLGVTRDPDLEIKDGKAVVRVTMPAPKAIVIAASGSVETTKVASGSVDIAIGGSGSVAIEEIASESLEIAIGGSGSVMGSGTTDRLEIAIGGSGEVLMPGLKADRAEIAIGGSGDVAFASDGTVEASIAGSGDIKVTGSAKCEVSSFGSGTLTCSPAPAPAEPEPATAEEG